MIHLKCVITGTGRCGTLYGAMLLDSYGIACGHESVFTNSGLRKHIINTKNPPTSPISKRQCGTWLKNKKLEADSSYMAAPYLDQVEGSVIHFIRDPLKVISSFVRGMHYFWNTKPSNQYERFIYSHLPQLSHKMRAVERAALYYLDWNELIVKKIIGKNYVMHNIDSDPYIIKKMLGVEQNGKFDDKEINSIQKLEVKILLINNLYMMTSQVES